MPLAFHDEEERVVVYMKPTLPLGTMLAHVQGTNLGLWGNEVKLRDDAAFLLHRELRGFLIEHAQQVIDPSDGAYGFVEMINIAYLGKWLSQHGVAQTRAFDAAFCTARVHASSRDAVLTVLMHVADPDGALARQARAEQADLAVERQRTPMPEPIDVVIGVLLELGFDDLVPLGRHAAARAGTTGCVE